MALVRGGGYGQLLSGEGISEMTHAGPNDPGPQQTGAQPQPPGGGGRPLQGPDFGPDPAQQARDASQGPAFQQHVGYRPTNVLAIVALVLTFVFAPAGLVLGIVAKGQIKTSGEDGEGLATAAIIVSSIFIAIWVIAMIAILGVFASVAHNQSGLNAGGIGQPLSLFG